MESIAAKYLHRGEEICWTGQPESFPLLGKSTKLPVLLNWCATGVITALFLAYYFLALCRETCSPVFVGLVLAVAATIMYAPVKKQRNLKGARYYITNERAMVVTRDASYYCLDLKDLDHVRTIQDSEGAACLLLGSGLARKPEKGLDWRSQTVKPAVHTEGPWDYTESMIFFRAADLDGAMEALRCAAAS